MRKIALVAALLLAFAAHALNWSTHGPLGGEITSVVFATTDPRTIYAGGNGGVFRSTDAGDSWANVSGPLHRVDHLVIDPTNVSVVYATAVGKIWKTIDAGASWIDITKGTTSTNLLTSLVIDPQNPSTLYYASGCYAGFDIPESHLYNAGLFKSTDGGATWKPAMNGLIPYHHCVQELAIDPAVPQHLIFEPPYNDWGVPESFDGGEHWSTTRDLVPTREVLDDPQWPLTRYGISVYFHGFVISGDGGLTWKGVTAVAPPDDTRNVVDLAIDHVTRRLFSVIGEGVFRTGNGGLSWAKIDAPAAPNGIVVDAGAGYLFLATQLGLYRAPLGTFGPWTPMPLADIGSATTNVAVDPHDPAVVFTRTLDYYNYDSFTWHGRIFVSRDYGRSWTRLREADDMARSAMTVDGNGNLLTVIRKPHSGIDERLARVDSRTGVVSDLRPLFNLVAIATEAENASVIHAADGAAIYTTYDGGATWRSLPNTYPTSLTIDPSDARRVFAGSTLGLLKSEDRGMTWTRIDSLWTGQVEIAPSKPSTIYRITEDPVWHTSHGTLRRSDDSGATWTLLKWPGESTYVSALVVDPRDHRSLWIVSTSDYYGMFHSSDGGATWQRTLSNLPDLPVDLAVDRQGVMIHAATTSTGVWDSPLVTHPRVAGH